MLDASVLVKAAERRAALALLLCYGRSAAAMRDEHVEAALAQMDHR